ncbi:tRNA(Ile)-lysidine synthetase [Prochlorococcus sp. MIT 0602]|nr:tRNA(Ile)-lysidine synthetase [Prochlorococcus sp. MIT 0602]KGG16001.1 tRNA(Ile)-lysidine synthetase [Prochlorococcus sp. MIT 0603]
MALLRLILDLKRIYQWELHVWHGDHGWHKGSTKISNQLKKWCANQDVPFFFKKTNKKNVLTEKDAREWRYTNLIKQAELLSKANPSLPCKHVLTGHTGSDRTETFLMNLARGSHLKGLSSLKECRKLEKDIELIRPMLIFSRKETKQICNELDIPIWIDPSNSNLNFSRNRIREEVIPVLEDLHPGSSIRIAQLADNLSKLDRDQYQLTKFAIKAISYGQGLCREKVGKLSLTARAMILTHWIRENNGPILSTKQLQEFSRKISPGKPPGTIHLSDGLQISWNKHSILIIK